MWRLRFLFWSAVRRIADVIQVYACDLSDAAGRIYMVAHERVIESAFPHERKNR